MVDRVMWKCKLSPYKNCITAILTYPVWLLLAIWHSMTLDVTFLIWFVYFCCCWLTLINLNPCCILPSLFQPILLDIWFGCIHSVSQWDVFDHPHRLHRWQSKDMSCCIIQFTCTQQSILMDVYKLLPLQNQAKKEVQSFVVFLSDIGCFYCIPLRTTIPS